MRLAGNGDEHGSKDKKSSAAVLSSGESQLTQAQQEREDGGLPREEAPVTVQPQRADEANSNDDVAEVPLVPAPRQPQVLQAQAARRSQEITAAIESIQLKFNTYVQSGSSSVFKKNAQRIKLFERLTSSIDQVKNDVDEARNDLEKLEVILDLLKRVEEINNDKTKYAETSKDSAIALQEAFAIIDPLYRAALIQENARLVALNAPAALEVARLAGWEAHVRDLQEKTAEAKTKSLEDPLALVIKAIQDGTFDKLDLDAIHARLTEQSQATRIQRQKFTPVQQQFYRDLDATLTSLRSPVSQSILMLIVLSPLADRYDALLEKAKKSRQSSSRELRAMLKTIGDIVRICLSEQHGSLQDLHHLFMLRDEKKLLEVLHLLQAEKLLSLREIDVSVMPQAQPDASAQIARLLEEAQSEELDMNMMGVAVDRIQAQVSATETTDSSSASSSAVPNLDAIRRKIDNTGEFYVHCVRISATISHLVEEIKASSQQLANLTQLTAHKQRYELLKTMAADLATKYKMLIQLTTLLRENQTVLAKVVESLNTAYHEQRNAQSRGMNVDLQNAAAGLLADYAKWNAEHRLTQGNLVRALTPFAALISGESALNATVELTGAVEAAQAEEALLAQIRDDAVEVQAVLQRQALQGHPNDSVPQPMVVETSGPVSVKLAVDLANKFSANKSDPQPGIKLVEKLQRAALFVPEIQSQFLRHPNVGVLLRLQTFLEESSIRVTPAQLSKLWDTLLRNDPDFDLLKPLQAQLRLSPETQLMIIEKFSETWEGSLTLLNKMFEGREVANQSTTFEMLVQASKEDNGLIEAVYKLYEKLLENQDKTMDENQRAKQHEMLEDFFNADNMAELIDCIQHAEYEFADEVVMRLDAVNTVPFKLAQEDFSYLLKRTKQFDERNLSYALLLKTWQETPETARGQYFDDANSTLLAAFDKPQYDGGLQLNIKPVRPEPKPGEPAIANVAYAQKVLACAYSLPRPVDYVSLQAEGKKKQAANVNLNPEQQFLLELMTTVSRSRAAIVMDRKNNPSFVAWVNDPNAPVLDHYTYFVIDRLQQGTAELHRFIREANALNQQLLEQGKVTSGMVVTAAVEDAEEDADIARLNSLIARIDEIKLGLTEAANNAFSEAFETSADLAFGSTPSSVASTGSDRFMQPVLWANALLCDPNSSVASTGSHRFMQPVLALLCDPNSANDDSLEHSSTLSRR